MEIDVNKCLTQRQQEDINLLTAPLAGGDPVKAFCEAAIAEFADALFSRRPESASMTPQSRLYFLIKYAFGYKIPSETVVSRLFGIQERRALSMISTVANRYRSELEQGFVLAITAAFNTKETVDASGALKIYRFNAPQVVIDHLKEIVASLQGGKLAPIQKVKNSAELFEVTSDTYKAICKHLKIKVQ